MFVHTHTCQSQEITHTPGTLALTHTPWTLNASPTLDPERIVYKQDFKPFSLTDECKYVNAAALEMKCG